MNLLETSPIDFNHQKSSNDPYKYPSSVPRSTARVIPSTSTSKVTITLSSYNPSFMPSSDPSSLAAVDLSESQRNNP